MELKICEKEAENIIRKYLDLPENTKIIITEYVGIPNTFFDTEEKVNLLRNFFKKTYCDKTIDYIKALRSEFNIGLQEAENVYDYWKKESEYLLKKGI